MTVFSAGWQIAPRHHDEDAYSTVEFGAGFGNKDWAQETIAEP